jgi:hypothetical protein
VALWPSRAVTINVDVLRHDDYIEDYPTIERVEPGRLWFDGGIGPVGVNWSASR